MNVEHLKPVLHTQQSFVNLHYRVDPACTLETLELYLSTHNVMDFYTNCSSMYIGNLGVVSFNPQCYGLLYKLFQHVHWKPWSCIFQPTMLWTFIQTVPACTLETLELYLSTHNVMDFYTNCSSMYIENLGVVSFNPQCYGLSYKLFQHVHWKPWSCIFQPNVKDFYTNCSIY